MKRIFLWLRRINLPLVRSLLQVWLIADTGSTKRVDAVKWMLEFSRILEKVNFERRLSPDTMEELRVLMDNELAVSICSTALRESPHVKNSSRLDGRESIVSALSDPRVRKDVTVAVSRMKDSSSKNFGT